MVHVHIKVKPDRVQNFIAASLENASHSIQEPGIERFDLVQSQEDSTQFVLEEVYRTQEATVAHKATEHYAKWRDAVADMMEVPRFSKKYTQLNVK